MKDATIFEECLNVSRRLKGVGFPGKRIFCTSNKKDYCESGSRPFTNVAVDLADVGMALTTSLPWAVNVTGPFSLDRSGPFLKRW